VSGSGRYQWFVGGLAVALFVAFAVNAIGSGGNGTIGVPRGQYLRPFAAPLAATSLVGDANLHPPCDRARHDARALNICLLTSRGPLVLAFFVTDAKPCVRTIDSMQAVSAMPGMSGVQFAAVAVRAGPGDAAAAVRKHHWTIPVAYDRDGAVGADYRIEVCPLLELARRGGLVVARLSGDSWSEASKLAAQVRLIRGS
jgi:hypothetical protein